MSLKFEDDQGVWRTIAGRKVFIREGQSLSTAMKQSGKFKSGKKEIKKGNDYGKEHDEKNYREIEKQLLEDYTKVDTEDLEEYYKIFKEQGKEKFAGRIKNELEKRENQSKNLNDLKQERDAKFREIVDANTKRQDIYEYAMSDEAYKDLYGKDPEKNAKTELNEKDHKRFEELTNKYHEGRKQLAALDKKIDEYRKSHPEEHAKEKQERQAKREEYLKTHLSLNETLDNPKRSIEISKEAKRLGISEREAKNLMDKREQKNTNDKFYYRKDGTREYDPYKGTPYEKKYDSVKDVIKDPNSKLNQYIKNKTAQKAYQKYLKEHPNSKLSFNNFKDMYSK